VDLPGLKRNWDAFGKTDPLWAVLTDSSKVGRGWDVDEFMRTGEQQVDALIQELASLGIETRGSMLDFGCGVGRLTQAFARTWDECVGVDIAPSMIAKAQELNRFGETVRYVTNDAGDLAIFDDAKFDLVYTFLVLQHMDPTLAREYICEFFRVTKLGGVVVIQIPSYLPRLPRSGCSAAITASPPLTMEAGSKHTLRATVTNTSSSTWAALPGARVRIGNHWRRRIEGCVCRDDGRADLPGTLGPDDSVDVSVPVNAPAKPGRYVLELDLVQEGVTWFAEQGSRTFRATVKVTSSVAPEPRRGWSGGPTRPATTTQEPVEPSIEPTMEMHGIPREEVIALVEACGGTILRVDPDISSLPWESFTYYATRPSDTATMSQGE
jgi:SAM-dependent methyltransferase